MKKKIIVVACILLSVMLFIPIPLHLKDGGTVKYQAVLYSISDVHRLVSGENDVTLETGVIVELLGFEVFNNVAKATEKLSLRIGSWYEWGVVLEAQNVTPSGLTIVCNQSGGENVSELSTGSFYVIQKLEEAGWTDLEYLPQEYDIAWNSIAYIIQKEGTTTWDVNWEWLYGVLPAGKYRIGKEIMNFRATGDYDVEMLYAEFACGID